MSIFLFAVLGFLIGSVAAKVVRGQSRAGVIGDLGMAVAGSIAVGWFAQQPFGIDGLSTAGVAAALVGGILFVAIERFAAGGRTAH